MRGPQVDDGAEDAVDEPPRVLTPVLLGKLDSLVDDDLARRTHIVEQLTTGRAQDGPIHAGDLLERPRGRGAAQKAVDLVLMIKCTRDDAPCKVPAGRGGLLL